MNKQDLTRCAQRSYKATAHAVDVDSFCPADWVLDAMHCAYHTGRSDVERLMQVTAPPYSINGKLTDTARADFQQRQEAFFKAIAPWQKVKADIAAFCAKRSVETERAGDVALCEVHNVYTPAQQSNLDRCDDAIAMLFRMHFKGVM